MTTALILLVVVLITHYFPKIPLITDFITAKGAGWVKLYLEFILNIFKKTSLFSKGEFVAVIIVLLVLLITFLINSLFHLVLKEWGDMIFMAVLLYYCLSSHPEDDHESILVLAHERTFGVIFWFSILGAPGAMLYWILTISRAVSDIIVIPIASFQRGLNIMHGLAAWIPARITGFIYALVGDFVRGFNCWLSFIKTATTSSSRVLLDCGQSALNSISSKEEDELVQRALIAWVILGMLIALIIAEVILE